MVQRMAGVIWRTRGRRQPLLRCVTESATGDALTGGAHLVGKDGGKMAATATWDSAIFVQPLLLGWTALTMSQIWASKSVGIQRFLFFLGGGGVEILGFASPDQLSGPNTVCQRDLVNKPEYLNFRNECCRHASKDESMSCPLPVTTKKIQPAFFCCRLK